MKYNRMERNFIKKGGEEMSVQVGKQAPDFTAKAYHDGMAKELKLSDYRGKWLMLCFYPADFTCV
jgi:alkyl hydroperoxide reductase subunit AhpC